jgi:hydrogenase small subunit
MPEETIYERLQRTRGFTRRDFMKVCGALVGAMGLSQAAPIAASNLPEKLARTTPETKLTHRVAEALQTKTRLPIIWQEFQDCAGCTEALTRSQHPSLVNLVLNDIAVDYHETLMAAAGHQAEDSRRNTMEQYAGQYVLVVEGGIPLANNGVYCTVAGRTALDIVRESAENSAAVIAIGNCATFSGIQGADPNPTGARGLWDVIDRPVVNIPGCPPIPEVFTGTLAHFLIFGNLPELDSINRPLTFYGTTVHDRCLRRPFYEAGQFAASFDDEGARRGWCLYKLGCKGPTSYNACASLKWQGGVSFPVQSGHPCFACSEPDFWDQGGFYQGQSAPLDPPALAAAGAAAAAGAVLGAGLSQLNRSQKKKAAKKSPATGEDVESSEANVEQF